MTELIEYAVGVRVTSTEVMRILAPSREHAEWIATHGRTETDDGELVGEILDIDRGRGADSDRVLQSCGLWGYDGAVQGAAASQGLNPIMAQLRSAGIKHLLYQSGGFCMIVTVPLANGDEVYCTSAEELFGARPDEVYVQRETVEMQENGVAGDEPSHVVTIAELPSLIRQLSEGWCE